MASVVREAFSKTMNLETVSHEEQERKKPGQHILWRAGGEERPRHCGDRRAHCTSQAKTLPNRDRRDRKAEQSPGTGEDGEGSKVSNLNCLKKTGFGAGSVVE